jgi:hypothetical protein
VRWGLALTVFVAACAARTDPAPSSRTLVYLTPTEHLVRASMALRGVRPSLDELRQVAAKPGSLPQIVDRYLQTPEFGATVRELHNEALLLRIQRPELTYAAVRGLTGLSFNEISSSQFEEPLRLIENVVMTDQPYSRIVTADYTMADRIVATIYGMPHSNLPGWEPTEHMDGRPAAGILVSDALHVRYRSAAMNYERGRANAISRALLCHDFLAGDVKIDSSINLADSNAVTHAVIDNPSCAACHQTLDPLASYFFAFGQGVYHPDGVTKLPTTIYDATQTAEWLFTNARPPSYFGQDTPGLDGLGKAIAADPRFARCAAIHFASYLTEVPADQLDPEWIAELQNTFEQSGLLAKQLARAVVLSDQFRVGSSSDPGEAEGVVGYQKARPAQLSRMLQALTGYAWTGYSDAPVTGQSTWTTGPIDYLDDDLNGFRVLGGGIDSFLVTQPVHTMNATSSMVSRLAAYHAAAYVVQHDTTAAPGDRTLFTAASVEASDEASVRAELGVLHARIFGELAPNVDASYQLFAGVLAASGDPRRAWVVTLTGMLSDLKAVYY